MGIANYLVYVFYPWGSRAKEARAAAAQLLLLVAVASACFSVYLLYVLKFVLKDFCVVCTTFHTVNFAMLFFAAVPHYLETRIAHAPPGSKSKHL